ncbi:ankyrin repeat domain-containing protein [Parashewanella tropica]|uniref:ankyrin repeat domain-containing protein n=1 Tax=Parashewanella tropica TaxID=2547970 RepID=UPI001059B5AA|nr:ankyrin repeat domain-containing protein [Parashewanella tropica]
MEGLTSEYQDSSTIVQEYPQQPTATIRVKNISGKYQLDCDAQIITGLVENESFDVQLTLPDENKVLFHCQQREQRGLKNGLWVCTNERLVPSCCGLAHKDPNSKLTRALRDTLEFKDVIVFFTAIVNSRGDQETDSATELVKQYLKLPSNLSIKTSTSNFSLDARKRKNIILHRGSESFSFEGTKYSDFLCKGQTSLHLAVHVGNAHLIPLLVQSGVDPHEENDLLQTPLDLAVYQDRFDEANALLVAGTQIERTNGCKLLNIALANSFENETSQTSRVGQLLVDNGVNIDALDDSGNTLLMNRIHKNDRGGVVFALKNGADISARGAQSVCAVELMVALNRFTFLELLFEHYKSDCPDINGAPFKAAFEHAAKTGKCAALDLFIEKGIRQTAISDVEFPSKELLSAARNTQNDACQTLLAHWFSKNNNAVALASSSEVKTEFEQLLQKEGMEGAWAGYTSQLTPGSSTTTTS